MKRPTDPSGAVKGSKTKVHMVTALMIAKMVPMVASCHLLKGSMWSITSMKGTMKYLDMHTLPTM